MKNLVKKRNKNTENYFADLVKEQAERIAELKKQNAELTLALESYKSKEAAIAETLDYARKKSAEMASEAKVKYALECERLKAFRKKWTSLARSGNLAASLERTENLLRECQAELEKGLSDDLGTADYIAERERLDAEPNLNYEAIIEEEANAVQTKKQIEELSDEELEELLTQI